MVTYGRQSLANLVFHRKIQMLSLFAPASDVSAPEAAVPTPPSSLVSRSNSSDPPRKSTSSVDTDISVTYSSSADFSKALTAAYNAAKPSSSGYIWCPIFKQYLPPDLIASIHIIPTYMDPGPIGYIFGNEQDGSDHIHSLSNGLLLAKCVANLFENSDFAIIPASTEDGNGLNHPTLYGNSVDEQKERNTLRRKPESQWQVIAGADGVHVITSTGIDRSTVNDVQSLQDAEIKLKLVLMKPWMAKTKLKGMEITYADLHNTPLEFRSSFRPDMRYLYFHYVTSILKWLNIQEAALYKDAWKPKEGWLRESLIAELARPGRLGNWKVYEELLAGRGMFDDSNEQYEEEWVDVKFQIDSGLGKSKVENMAMRLSFGLLVLSG
ncbi:hypothetical protein TWF696_008995 [Orbilia brochopaga]|uniref:HNH nuclease domain-containing protein n=1 Tax=Orbilia brochopaga TaxID=3140254 RepID=A0AAV9UDZ6_9PEZI